MKTYIAVDLGAGSGRVIASCFDGEKLTMEQLNRFDNTPIELNGHLFWNVPALLEGIRAGLRAAVAKYGDTIASVGVDTWGVDYVLLDKQGRLLSLPYIYRDCRNTTEQMDKVYNILGKRELYNATGTQFMTFNTIFQLFTEAEQEDSFLPKADKLLFMPDFINYALCGKIANEATIASTTQLINVNTRDWDTELMAKLNIPARLFSKPTPPGTVLGNIKGIPGLENVPVVTVGSHDTASAVASVPAKSDTCWGYLATGTWALMGVISDKPILSDLSYEYSYTHEGATDGQFRYLKNCTGMWLVQELRRAWKAKGEEVSFDELEAEAAKSEPFKYLIDADYSEFQSPGNMPEKIQAYCKATGQLVPQTKGELYRAALEGIVMRYRKVWKELEALTGVKRNVLHMIGGATMDKTHCRMTADALGIDITCGPVEGASMGNVVAQMVGLGDLSSFDAGRDLIGASIEKTTWTPEPAGVAAWAEAAERWEKLCLNSAK